jgi:hypothetical protein
MPSRGAMVNFCKQALLHGLVIRYLRRVSLVSCFEAYTSIQVFVPHLSRCRLVCGLCFLSIPGAWSVVNCLP